MFCCERLVLRNTCISEEKIQKVTPCAPLIPLISLQGSNIFPVNGVSLCHWGKVEKYHVCPALTFSVTPFLQKSVFVLSILRIMTVEIAASGPSGYPLWGIAKKTVVSQIKNVWERNEQLLLCTNTMWTNRLAKKTDSILQNSFYASTYTPPKFGVTLNHLQWIVKVLAPQQLFDILPHFRLRT